MIGAMILTHGRAGKVHTTKTLANSGWTGPVHYIVDDEDPQIEDYKRIYGDDVVHTFSKADEAARMDSGDLSDDRGVIVYARNASQRIARDLGWDYLWQLDDDYKYFGYRYPIGTTLLQRPVRSLDTILEHMATFLEGSGALTVALAQAGDLIGGLNGNYRQRLIRKAMNSFLIRTNRPIDFIGRINEDVNTYVSLGNRGELFFTIMDISLTQGDTQQNEGGMTQVYLEGGTYLKSFHTVMRNPSSVRVMSMGAVNRRLHHRINWRLTVPKIVPEDTRKERGK